MPTPPKVRPKFFTGDSRDLKSLEQEYGNWLIESQAVPVNMNTTVHYDTELKRWEIIVHVYYQVGGPQVIKGVFSGNPQRVD